MIRPLVQLCYHVSTILTDNDHLIPHIDDEGIIAYNI